MAIMQVPVLDTTISPPDGSLISFQPGHNSVVLTYNSSMSLIYEEVRITKNPTVVGAKIGEAIVGTATVAADSTVNYGIGIGVLAHFISGNIAANTTHTITIPVNSTNFSEGDGVYTVSLYVKNAIDGSWNEYHYFITVDDEYFIPSGTDEEMMVVTDQAIPS